MTKKLILEIELVPSTSWYTNVRSAVTKNQWDKIKSIVASKAYYVCEICGGAGSSHPVECHEVWLYDDKKHIQTLERMIALCPKCHMVKHFGLHAIVRKKYDLVLNHLMKVNKISKEVAEKHIKREFEKHTQRSAHSWKLNLNHLKDYGIDISKLKLNNDKEILEGKHAK